MAANTECASTRTGMLIPIRVSLNECVTIDSGRIALHPTMSFTDLLSAIERNLTEVFVFSRSASVISIDMVERDTSLASSCSYITPVDQTFDFSSLSNKRYACRFLVKVDDTDPSWDMERGDPIIEFKAWKNWRGENQNGVQCRQQTLPTAGPHGRSIES